MGEDTTPPKPGIEEAESFCEEFSISDTPGVPTVITVQEFNDWMAKAGYCPPDCEPATRREIRNLVRSKLNKVGSSKYWREDHKSRPFHLRVGQHGRNFVLAPAFEGYTATIAKFPKQLRSVTVTKRSHSAKLFSAIEREQLTPEQLIYVTIAERAVSNFTKRALSEDEFLLEEVMYTLEKLNEVAPNLPRLGVRTTIEIGVENEDDSEDDSEDDNDEDDDDTNPFA